MKTAEAIAAMAPIAAMANKEMVDAAFENDWRKASTSTRLFHGLFTEDQKEAWPRSSTSERRPGREIGWHASQSSGLAIWAAGWPRTSEGPRRRAFDLRNALLREARGSRRAAGEGVKGPKPCHHAPTAGVRDVYETVIGAAPRRSRDARPSTSRPPGRSKRKRRVRATPWSTRRYRAASRPPRAGR